MLTYGKWHDWYRKSTNKFQQGISDADRYVASFLGKQSTPSLNLVWRLTADSMYIHAQLFSTSSHTIFYLSFSSFSLFLFLALRHHRQLLCPYKRTFGSWIYHFITPHSNLIQSFPAAYLIWPYIDNYNKIGHPFIYPLEVAQRWSNNLYDQPSTARTTSTRQPKSSGGDARSSVFQTI